MDLKNKILIVDDSPSIVLALRDILEADYSVYDAGSGEEAFEKLPDIIPDIILLDVELPGINGYEICRRIRAEKMYGFVKIIMLTSCTSLEDCITGYQAGADDYVGKPFKKDELLAKVRVFLRLKTVEDQLKNLNSMLNEQVDIRTQQLVDAEKMATIGRLTAGIVHNLNTPLQGILGYAQLLELEYPENKEIKKLTRAANNMKQIIRTILNTSHRSSTNEYANVNINEVLENQIELQKANPFFKQHVLTKTHLEPIPPYHGLYVHFSQSLGNLINNAVEALYDSEVKELTISTGLEKSSIVIKIADTGPGISRKNLDKIFNPFFTTKPLTADDDRPTGTGLGLASCREMIASYGGTIRVESKEGCGTTFTVVLPLYDESDRDSPPAADAPDNHTAYH